MYQSVEPIEIHAERLFVKEQQRGKRLVLGCRGDLTIGGQVVQECSNGRLPQFGRVSLAMKVNEPLGPVDVCFLRPPAVMQASYRPTQPIPVDGGK